MFHGSRVKFRTIERDHGTTMEHWHVGTVEPELQSKPIVELHHEDLGAAGPETTAQIPQRRELAWPGLIAVGDIPDQIERAAAPILPAEHDVAAQRLVVEVGVR